MGLLELFKRKSKRLKDRNVFRPFVVNELSNPFHRMSSVCIDQEDAQTARIIMNDILDRVVGGQLKGQVSWRRELSPLCRKMVEFVANGSVYFEGCFKVNYDWSDLTVNKIEIRR